MAEDLINKSSAEWLEIKNYCLSRLAEMREENDGDLGLEETAKLRGMIAFASEVISLDEKKEQVAVTDTTYVD